VLSKGETFAVEAPGGEVDHLSFSVVETAPADAVCIVDTDVAVDFAPMPGYEPDAKPKQDETATTAAQPETPKDGFVPFGGTAHRVADLSASAEDAVECKNCGKRIPTQSAEMHKMRCERLNIRCALCSKVIARTDETKHMADEHAQVECPRCKCQVEKCNLETHAKIECTAALVACQYCEVPVKKAELAAHERYCGSKTEPCQTCHRTLRKMDMLAHVSSGCDSTPPVYHGHQDQREHLRESVMICPTCNGVFTDLGLLVSHVESRHGGLVVEPEPELPMPRLPTPKTADERMLWCPKCKNTSVMGEAAL
jgi:phage FluMu protein Com